MDNLKKNSKRFNCLLIIALLMAAGCAPPLYYSNSHHTHLLDKKGEIDAAVYTGSNGVDLQGAYAITDNIGVIGAGSVAFGQKESGTLEENESNEQTHQHRYGEIGLVYFSRIGEKGRFELLGGSGWGSSSAYGEIYLDNRPTIEGTVDASYNKLFLQANIGLDTGAFETGLALRWARVAFNNFETEAGPLGISQTTTFLEPTLFARLGWEKVKFEFQLGVVNHIGERNLIYDWNQLSGSIGIRFNFNTQSNSL